MPAKGARKCGACGGWSRTWLNVFSDGDAKHKAWKKSVLLLLRAHWRRPPLNGPVRCSMVFVFQRPKSRPTVSKTRMQKGVKQPNPHHVLGRFKVSKEDWARGDRVPHASIPDRDNLEKAIMDLMTNAGVWHDDGQVCAGEVRKFYAAVGESPSIRIRVEEL
jgi:Holliday junction resolvase RusA-like endonuclease